MSDKMKVMVGNGWMLTAERNAGYPPPEPPGRLADAFTAFSRALAGAGPSQQTPINKLWELHNQWRDAASDVYLHQRERDRLRLCMVDLAALLTDLESGLADMGALKQEIAKYPGVKV